MISKTVKGLNVESRHLGSLPVSQSVSQPIIVSQPVSQLDIVSQSASCQSTKQSASQSYSQKATLASPISPFGEE